jgi:hypothetical protein
MRGELRALRELVGRIAPERAPEPEPEPVPVVVEAPAEEETAPAPEPTESEPPKETKQSKGFFGPAYH